MLNLTQKIHPKLGSFELVENLTQTQVDQCDFSENKIYVKFKHFHAHFQAEYE